MMGQMSNILPRDDCASLMDPFDVFFRIICTVSEDRFCTTNLRGWQNVTDGMVIVVFGFLAGSADTLLCGERKT